MPLIQPNALREKLLVIGAGGAGKTTLWLSIAFWAKVSGDTRKFYVLDTDDEAVLHVLNEPKYDGLLHSLNGELIDPEGNIVLWSAYTWDEYERFSTYSDWLEGKGIAVQAQPGDWIILDFITHAWTAAQEGFLHDAVSKTRGQVLVEAGKEGLSGWDMFKTDFNWNAINGAYYDFIKPILNMSKAHVFMTAEEESINTESRNITPDNREHAAQFGKFKAIGQKKLPYQCRSYLRVQRLARGRVLYTMGKDRARRELEGDDVKDFFQDYLCSVAGWSMGGSGMKTSEAVAALIAAHVLTVFNLAIRAITIMFVAAVVAKRFDVFAAVGYVESLAWSAAYDLLRGMVKRDDAQDRT